MRALKKTKLINSVQLDGYYNQNQNVREYRTTKVWCMSNVSHRDRLCLAIEQNMVFRMRFEIRESPPCAIDSTRSLLIAVNATKRRINSLVRCVDERSWCRYSSSGKCFLPHSKSNARNNCYARR